MHLHNKGGARLPCYVNADGSVSHTTWCSHCSECCCQDGLKECRVLQITFRMHINEGQDIEHHARIITYVNIKRGKAKLVSMLINDMGMPEKKNRRDGTAITAYCLVAIVQHDMQLKRSTYEVLQILSMSLTYKTPLSELFDKTYSNDVKEQLGPLIPGLFD